MHCVHIHVREPQICLDNLFNYRFQCCYLFNGNRGKCTYLGGSSVGLSPFPTSRMLFRSLASTDLCVGLISQPCFGIFLFSVITNRMRICKITEGILHASRAVLCGISLSNLTAIRLDRLLALQLGLRYRQVVTVPRVRGVIALSWLVYTSLGLLYYLNVDRNLDKRMWAMGTISHARTKVAKVFANTATCRIS